MLNKIQSLIRGAVELSNKSKLFNWTTHALALGVFAGLGLVLSGPIMAHLASHGDGVRGGILTAVDAGTIVYFWREAETVFNKWNSTGEIKVLEDNLGDLVGPIVVWVVAHLA